MTTIVRFMLAAAIGLGLPALSQAQTYPARPIKIIVPSPAGATTDTLVRMMAQKLSEKWGQPVIVDNKPGAGGNIGAEEAAKAAPDGYTLLFTYPAPLIVNQTLYKQLAYDPDSFVPISLVAAVPLVLAVPPKEEATTVQQLIALAKAHPGQLNFASQGYGTSAPSCRRAVQIDGGDRHRPRAVQGQRAGAHRSPRRPHRHDVHRALDGAAADQCRQAARARRRQRDSATRSCPTCRRWPKCCRAIRRRPGSAWSAPPGTPPEIAAKLSSAVAEAIREPDMAKRLVDMSATAIGDTPAQMADFLRDERQRWGGVIRAAGVKAE